MFSALRRCKLVEIPKLLIMTSSILAPEPDKVRGMKVLDKDLFRKSVHVPCAELDKNMLPKVLPDLKKYILKLENFKAIRCVDDTDNVRVYLNPDTSQSTLDNFEVEDVNVKFSMKNITLGYENYNYDDILKSILPNELEGFSSFTIVGHILHLNLREHLLPFKAIIGQVLLEKIKNCRSVVNKIENIDNTFRNFEMELICGENNFETRVKENNCIFEFDFSKVYWNSRLCTEHERIINSVNQNDIFVDLFAGVGPFSVPISRKNCKVFANDLNPESFKWLNHNIKLNRIKTEFIETFNLDAKEFILNNLSAVLTENLSKKRIFIAMNLPALAVQFLKYFKGILNENVEIPNPIICFVYCFAKGSENNENYEEIARNLIRENLGTDEIIGEIFHVRSVSNYKKMMRVKLDLRSNILCANSCSFKRKNHDELLESKYLKSNCFLSD